jgi:GTPase SAR1 family protein
MNDELTLLKIFLYGDSKIGKSSFLYKFVINEVPKNIQPTSGK